MEYDDRTLPILRAITFFRAIRDDDSFTVLWELAAHSPAPVPFESIRKTFGADPRYLLEVLSRLRQLGVATKAGQQWTVCDWAKSSLEYLEELMKNVQIEVAQPVSPVLGIYANDPLEVATLDGFWVGSTSQITARSGTLSPSSASPKGVVNVNSELADNPKNETRSHDYK
jgi:hypothetical protein